MKDGQILIDMTSIASKYHRILELELYPIEDYCLTPALDELAAQKAAASGQRSQSRKQSTHSMQIGGEEC